MADYFYMVCFIYLVYNITKSDDINLVRTDGMKDSIYIYSLTKGLGEFFWNLSQRHQDN